ncbi:MAG: restriction endonuclease subunit M [Conexibacter sp.]
MEISSRNRDGRPKSAPTQHFQEDSGDPLHRKGGWVWVPLKRCWLRASAEELVRQEFIFRLHTQWGYALAQMAQEVRTKHGRGSPRADLVAAESPDALGQNRDYRIAVETKAENVPITPDDYAQGESYARAVGAEFLVLHNQKETRFFRLVPGAPGERVEIVGIPKANELSNARRLEEIRRATTAFTRDEFQRLLHECHNILRDNHKMDPGAAFDEISKILFIKMTYERMGQSEVFTTDRLREIARVNILKDDATVLRQVFHNMREHYRADHLFGEDEALKVSLATFRRIVALLEKFNLSDTGDDIKGIAFEKFLGQTFRGELGQFFTPRPIVDFMVEMLDPREGEIVCDPAAGTGGFLIKVFEHLRSQIEQDVEAAKDAARTEIEQTADKPEHKRLTRVEEVQRQLNQDLDVTRPDSRLYRVAHDSIFGVDAEARAARTSKMNMIMHGDGHGGIYYHDGLLDTHGVFAGRFDVVITNPPFGSTVGRDQIVGSTEQTQVETDPDSIRADIVRFGEACRTTHRRMQEAAAERTPILELFDIGRDPIAAPFGTGRVRRARSTEMLFVERCLQLLKPGGRLGIVLPDGILNNPSGEWLREYVEARARLVAIVSIPYDVFASSDATVKTSLVFLRKFDDVDVENWGRSVADATEQVDAELTDERRQLEQEWALALAPGRADLLDDARRLVEQLQTAADASETTALRRRLVKHLSEHERRDARRVQKDVAGARRAFDEKRRTAIRQRTKELFDYFVFMAEVRRAGITATGETGEHVPNQLPNVRDLYRRFHADPAAFAEEVLNAMSENASGEAEVSIAVAGAV